MIACSKKRFESAEIAKLSRKDQSKYENSLMHYRDFKNIVDPSFDEGKAEGIDEGIQQGVQKGMVQIARQMKTDGVEIETIMRYTRISTDSIQKL
jgi:predicted transposase/invertase (TIGR01784 family)